MCCCVWCCCGGTATAGFNGNEFTSSLVPSLPSPSPSQSLATYVERALASCPCCSLPSGCFSSGFGLSASHSSGAICNFLDLLRFFWYIATARCTGGTIIATMFTAVRTAANILSSYSSSEVVSVFRSRPENREKDMIKSTIAWS